MWCVAELLMHEDRIDKHCAGIEATIDTCRKDFELMQAKLNDISEKNRSDVINLEIEFNNITKSFRLIKLQERLARQKERHVENVKLILRNFRTAFDNTLSQLRNSNAKFRFSFTVFSEGGNFSADEIDAYKKKLERMALYIDANETSLLKDMEKIEKKYLEEAIKIMVQFQDKFKFHLADLNFIEKITRWLNETQIKIKACVNESNDQSKQLVRLIDEFEADCGRSRRQNVDDVVSLSSRLK